MHLDPNNLFCSNKELKSCTPIFLGYQHDPMNTGWNLQIFRDRSFEFRATYHPGNHEIKVVRGNLEIEDKKLVFQVSEQLSVSALKWPQTLHSHWSQNSPPVPFEKKLKSHHDFEEIDIIAMNQIGTTKLYFQLEQEAYIGFIDDESTQKQFYMFGKRSPNRIEGIFVSATYHGTFKFTHLVEDTIIQLEFDHFNINVKSYWRIQDSTDKLKMENKFSTFHPFIGFEEYPVFNANLFPPGTLKEDLISPPEYGPISGFSEIQGYCTCQNDQSYRAAGYEQDGYRNYKFYCDYAESSRTIQPTPGALQNPRCDNTFLPYAFGSSQNLTGRMVVASSKKNGKDRLKILLTHTLDPIYLNNSYEQIFANNNGFGNVSNNRQNLLQKSHSQQLSPRSHLSINYIGNNIIGVLSYAQLKYTFFAVNSHKNPLGDRHGQYTGVALLSGTNEVAYIGLEPDPSLKNLKVILQNSSIDYIWHFRDLNLGKDSICDDYCPADHIFENGLCVSQSCLDQNDTYDLDKLAGTFFVKTSIEKNLHETENLAQEELDNWQNRAIVQPKRMQVWDFDLGAMTRMDGSMSLRFYPMRIEYGHYYSETLKITGAVKK